MLGKWFKRKSVPENTGKVAKEGISSLQFSKVFDLELSNMEDTPTYSLKHQLTIGSEIGNIIIADPSLSPRHATFILQQDVVSVIDHGSIAGTYVNGTRIPAGKYIILEESDTVNVGDLEVKIRMGTVAQEEEAVPELPQEEETVPDASEIEEIEFEENLPDDDEEEAPEVEPSPKKGITQIFDARKFLSQNKKKKKSISIQSSYSTNSLVRVVAVICDVLVAYSLMVVLMPFDEFREFLDFIPHFLLSLVDVDWSAIWKEIVADYGVLGEMSKDLYQFFSHSFHIGPLFLMFVLVRAISTLLFGVSISEYILSVRAGGNGVWARIGGVLRVLVGVITGPFLIFDVPAIISRRTFKEFFTFTQTYLTSKFVAVLGTILFLPLLIASALMAPMFQGFEPPEPILVNDRIDQRMKVHPQVAEGETAPEVKMVQDMSHYLNLDLTYDANEVAILPSFKFHGLKTKLNLKPSVTFYQKDLLRTVNLEVYKTFDLKELLGIGMKGNVFLYDKYPTIYNFVYAGESGNPAFRVANNEKIQMAFANEFISFTKLAFSLSPENMIEVMESETFLTKSLIDYKASFLALIEYKDFDKIGFIKIGNIIFMRISFNKQKPFDLIIPLMKGEGRIFKVNFDRRENLNNVSSKFYKFNLENANWFPDFNLARPPQEVMSAFQMVDLFSVDLNQKILTLDKAQAVYAYYFETSASVLSRKDQVELELWKTTVQTTMKLLESLPASKVAEGEEDPKKKLEQNFRDLSDALENANLEFFGLTESVSI